MTAKNKKGFQNEDGTELIGDHQETFQAGYDEGYEIGYEDGYEDGFGDGLDEGLDKDREWQQELTKMTLYPFMYCEYCGKECPFMYDFETNEWICFICGHSYVKPEDRLESPGKIRNSGAEWEFWSQH